ncbi:MAG: hypothetical protein Q8N23_12615 [Archangium sp.]|nr:hypothetical protein [Archangium sp.]MDP3574749.1 hypothetical protein [Archangium sp.]
MLEQDLKKRLLEDPALATLAKAVGATNEAMVSLVVHAALHPEEPRLEVRLKPVPGREEPVTPAMLATVVQKAIDTVRTKDPAFFASVQKQQVKVTNPGDQRTVDLDLKADLAKMLRSGRR